MRNVFFILPVALAGCSSGIGLDQRSNAVQVAQALPAPDRTATAIDLTDYVLGPNDEIKVSVFGAQELDREGTVDNAGRFSMPLLGNVLVGGKTPAQAEKQIADGLRGRYIKDPQVAVNIVKAQARTVTIDGAVREPGIYPIVGNMTLQQAVATAKGTAETADIDKIIVFRTVGGQKMAAMFNLKDIRSGRYEDPRIFPHDIVVVGENATRRLMRDAQMSFPLLAQFIPIL